MLDKNLVFYNFPLKYLQIVDNEIYKPVYFTQKTRILYQKEKPDQFIFK